MTEDITSLNDKQREHLRSPSAVLAEIVIALPDVNPSQSSAALARLFPKLGSHLERAGRVFDLTEVTESHIRLWVDAPLPDGRPPSLATRHSRRAAARLAFRLLRERGVVAHDPTVDLLLPRRNRNKTARPLTDQEVTAGRASSVATIGETFRPAAWALAEATATTHEIPRVLGLDIDVSRGTVWLGGSAKVEPRFSLLTEWGVRIISRRLQEVGDDTLPVAYLGEGTSAASMQASAATALGRTLRAAGLTADPSVKPASLRAWAGRQVFLRTGRIEQAALALGCKTLDTAADIIGFDWRSDQ